MKKNGFTLIELLAVIVILAIIALIATPIILGIINDAREESNERSVELYASAVRNAIAAYQLTGTSAPTKFSDLNVEKDGDIKCATEELYADGSFYIAGCTVNGTLVENTYGKKQPQYYYHTWDITGRIGETSAPENPLIVPPTDKNYYLGYDIDKDNKVSAAYACFVRNEKQYCLKGHDTEAFTTNLNIIKDAFKDVVDTDAFWFDGVDSGCFADGLVAEAATDGIVTVGYENENGLVGRCNVAGSDSVFNCYEY